VQQQNTDDHKAAFTLHATLTTAADSKESYMTAGLDGVSAEP